MSAAVTIEHLTKTFPGGRGVKDVSITIPEGRVFGFLGPNGAGKSTTIRCLLGLYRPEAGRIKTLEADPSSGDAVFLRQVGYLPGELNLPGSLTGLDVLTRFARIRGLRDLSMRDALIDRLGVETARPVGSLSKGNKQKIGLVVAFMHRPRLLVLDEPTSGLDPLVRERFTELVAETVAGGQTVLLSSHDLDEVQLLADRVSIIRAGRIIADETVADLVAHAPRTMQVFFDHDPDCAVFTGIPGVTVIDAAPRRVTLSHTGPVAALLTALAPLQPSEIIARPANLDELFLKLYNDDAQEA